MNRSVLRYGVTISDGLTQCPIPAGARIVHVGFGPNTEPGDVDVWLEADLDHPPADRWFCVRGTGHPVPDGARHVGSVHDEPRRLMWHVYEMDGA